MTGKVERDETLEEQGVSRVPSSQETEQTRCRAPKEAGIAIHVNQPSQDFLSPLSTFI
jgi:hypothetical protein